MLDFDGAPESARAYQLLWRKRTQPRLATCVRSTISR